MISILLSDEPEHLGQISTGLPGEPGVMPASKMGVLEMEPVNTGKAGGGLWTCQTCQGRV